MTLCDCTFRSASKNEHWDTGRGSSHPRQTPTARRCSQQNSSACDSGERKLFQTSPLLLWCPSVSPLKKISNNRLINPHGETSMHLTVPTCVELNKEQSMGPNTRFFFCFHTYWILAYFVFTKLREQTETALIKVFLNNFWYPSMTFWWHVQQIISSYTNSTCWHTGQLPTSPHISCYNEVITVHISFPFPCHLWRSILRTQTSKEGPFGLI
jgi:hypothetical protein